MTLLEADFLIVKLERETMFNSYGAFALYFRVTLCLILQSNLNAMEEYCLLIKFRQSINLKILVYVLPKFSDN